MTEYTIQPGQQNFSPPDPLGLTTRRGFRFRVAFHHSCYYSFQDWELDRDWFDVNKLTMLTLFYTPNNHLAYGAGFMPSEGLGGGKGRWNVDTVHTMA